MTPKIARSVGNKNTPNDETAAAVRADGAGLVNSLRRPRFTTVYGVTQAALVAFGRRPRPSIGPSRVNKAG